MLQSSEMQQFIGCFGQPYVIWVSRICIFLMINFHFVNKKSKTQNMRSFGAQIGAAFSIYIDFFFTFINVAAFIELESDYIDTIFPMNTCVITYDVYASRNTAQSPYSYSLKTSPAIWRWRWQQLLSISLSSCMQTNIRLFKWNVQAGQFWKRHS